MRFWAPGIFFVLAAATCAVVVDVCGWHVADPVPGEVWTSRPLHETKNPFREENPLIVEIVEVRHGWVHYRLTNGLDLHCEVTSFKRVFRRAK